MSSKIYSLFVVLRNILLDRIVTISPSANNHHGSKSSILLIKLDAIGDFVLWLDAAAQLRRLYPPDRYRLVLFGNALWSELAVQLPYFDEVIPVERERLYYSIRYRVKMWQLLRSREWAAAIYPTYSRDGNCGDAAVRVSNAAERIGSKGDLSNQPVWYRWISNRWYTRLLPVSSVPLMELERNAEFMRNLGVKDFRAGMPILAINPVLPPKFNAGNYIVVVPGGSLALKQWPVENFVELSERIHKALGVTVIICGSKSETGLGIRLLGLTLGKGVGWMEDWTGKTSLLEFVGIIKGANMLIGNDSSAVHISAAVGTPAFCIVGGGHFGRFVPYRLERESDRSVPVVVFHQMECFGCNLKCTKTLDSNNIKCISLITVDDVWKKVFEFIKTRKTN